MRYDIANFLSVFLQVYTLCVLGWVLLSWFEMRHTFYWQVRRFLDSVVEPYVNLFRRALPMLQIGGFDLSPIVAILTLQIVGNVIVDLVVYGI